jgi:hypothetical protein
VNERLFTAVLAQETLPPTQLLDHYRRRGASPVDCDADQLRRLGYVVMQAPLHGGRSTDALRHDPRSLATAVMRFYRNSRSWTAQ